MPLTIRSLGLPDLPKTDVIKIFRRPLTPDLGLAFAWTAVEREDAGDLLPVGEAVALLHNAVAADEHDEWGWVLMYVTEAYGLADQLEAFDALVNMARDDEELRHYGAMFGPSLSFLQGIDHMTRLQDKNPRVRRALELAAALP